MGRNYTLGQVGLVDGIPFRKEHGLGHVEHGRLVRPIKAPQAVVEWGRLRGNTPANKDRATQGQDEVSYQRARHPRIIKVVPQFRKWRGVDGTGKVSRQQLDWLLDRPQVIRDSRHHGRAHTDHRVGVAEVVEYEEHRHGECVVLRPSRVGVGQPRLSSHVHAVRKVAVPFDRV